MQPEPDFDDAGYHFEVIFMGWSFRRSARLGPLRINFSKSGVGWSLGGRGFRMGKDAKGRDYSQASIPGTGLYNRKYYPKTPPSGQSRNLSPQAYLWGLAIVLAIIYYIVR
jgi:hypothetical protein